MLIDASEVLANGLEGAADSFLFQTKPCILQMFGRGASPANTLSVQGCQSID
jgi:hypothetical protein